VYQDRVAGLHARRERVEVVGVGRSRVIRREQSGECRLLAFAFVVRRIDVVDLAASGRPRFRPRPHRHGALGAAAHAVRIGQQETAFVLSAGLELEDASGEPVRRDVLQRVLVDALVADAQQRETLPPRWLAAFPVRHRHSGIAIVVAVNRPLEPQ
jgi:hypothetical protein